MFKKETESAEGEREAMAEGSIRTEGEPQVQISELGLEWRVLVLQNLLEVARTPQLMSLLLNEEHVNLA